MIPTPELCYLDDFCQMFWNREPIGIGNPFVGRRVAHCDYTLWHTLAHCGTKQCARHRAATGKQSKPKTCCCVVHLQWAGTRRYSGVFLQIYSTLRYIMIQRNVSMHCKNWLVTACWVQIRTYSIFHLPAPAVLVLQIYGHLSKTGPTVGFLENWANLGNYL